MSQRSKKTSQVVRDVIASVEGDGSITVEKFLGIMGHRAQAMAIFILAIATVVAGAIPGFSTVSAVPIIFIALQMMLGGRAVWLPRSIREKHISSALMRNSLTRALPTLVWMERLLKPRLEWLTSGIFRRLLALVILVLAFVLALPIPGGNLLPSTTISLLSLAILERDGLLVIATLTLIGSLAKIMLAMITQAIHYTRSFF